MTHIFTVKPWVRRFKLFARVGDELFKDTIVVSQAITPTGEVKSRHTVDLHYSQPSLLVALLGMQGIRSKQPNDQDLHCLNLHLSLR